jgi:hypothetical protein
VPARGLAVAAAVALLRNGCGLRRHGGGGGSIGVRLDSKLMDCVWVGGLGAGRIDGLL